MPAAVAHLRLSLLAAGGLLALSLLGCHGAAVAAPPEHVRVYVAGADASLRVTDAATLAALPPIRLSAPADRLVYDPGRRRLYALSQAAGLLQVINVEQDRVLAAMALDMHPADLVLDPRHPLAYLAGVDARGQGALETIDLDNLRIAARARLGADPRALALTPDDAWLLVADQGQHAVVRVRPADLHADGAVALPAPPAELLVVPFGHTVFTLCPNVSQVAALDWNAPALRTLLPLPSPPADMQLKPDGGELYVSSPSRGLISIVDTQTNEITGLLLAGRGVGAMAIDAGDQLYAANRDANSVSIFNVDQRTNLGTIGVGAQPAALALGPVEPSLFVSDLFSNDLAVIRTQQRTLLTLLPGAPHPRALAVSWYP